MDIAIAVSMIYDDAKFSSSESYLQLTRTWRDTRRLPTELELATAWERYLQNCVLAGLAKSVQDARLATLQNATERQELDTDERLELLIEYLVNIVP